MLFFVVVFFVSYQLETVSPFIRSCSPVHLMVNFFVLCLSYVNFFKERESMNF